MDRISQLPDELLGKVLLFLPTKVAVSTSILSKRWKFLWMWLPNLEYDDSDYSLSQRLSLRRFLNLNLRLHRARVIERLHLKFRTGPTGSTGSPVKPKDIKLWVAVAVSHRIHELSLYLFDTISKHQTRLPSRLPSRLYMCKSIVILKLEGDILLDVPPTVCLPCLKTLSLQRVSYLDEDSLHQLLSNCPVLEDLDVKPVKNEYVYGTFRVIVPSLQRLTLDMFYSEHYEHMINTPSLRKLKVKDHSGKDVGHPDSYYFEDMPMLEEADIDMAYNSIDTFIRSITSVRRLSLCLEVCHSWFGPRYPEQNYYRESIVFNQLEHLQLCSCNEYWSDLLARLLKDSPNLRELEIYVNDEHDDMQYTVCQLINYVPEYVFWSLETFKWTQMYGSQEDVDLAKYILRNARNLGTATISFQLPSRMEKDKSVMIFEELFNCSRGSTCKLVLIQDLYRKLFDSGFLS